MSGGPRPAPEDLHRAAPRDLLLAALLGGLLFLPGLGNHDLWNPDEPRYAEVTREMLARGDHLVPHLNGSLYTHKPPLMFWAMAASAAVLGELDETAVRLPSALAAIGCLLLVYALGCRLFGRRAAWLAALAFGTSYKVLWQARTGQIDMLLTFLVTLAMYCWVRGHLEGRPAFQRSFFFFTGLATLAKGPVGLLPPLLGVLAFLAIRRDRRGLRELRLGTGLAIWAAVVLAWLVPAGIRAGGGYFGELLFTQNLVRYAAPAGYRGTRGHLHPWYYYLAIVPADFFPWSAFLPAALVAGWRRLLGRAGWGFLLAGCWAAATLLFFSLSPAKRSVYILTLYPALALLVGGGLDALAAGAGWRRRWLTWPAALLALGLGAAAVALPPILGRRPEAPLFPEAFPLQLGLLAGAAAAGAAAVWWLAARRRVVAMAAALAAAFGGAATVAFLWAAPRFDVVKSVRPLAERLAVLAAPGEPLGIYPGQEAAILFYSGRLGTELASEEQLRVFLGQPGRIWLLAEGDDLARLAEPLALQEVARSADPSNGYVLLARPGNGEAGAGGP